jgi:DNA-binding NtrC family response regulator
LKEGNFSSFGETPPYNHRVKTKARLLLVDDDPLIAESLAFALQSDYEVVRGHDRASAVERLREGLRPDLALIDLGLPPVAHLPNEGFKLIGDLLAHAPDVRILVLTGQNEESNARRARALGAVELVPKPCEPERLRGVLARALAATPIDRPGEETESARALVGDSPALMKLRSQIDLYAASTFPALIEGESGSGKERVAYSLHHLSPRAALPFLALNCAAISPSLVEPTLFGYAKGAFTGAVQAKSGYFEDAGEGTLFLDEIGELALELQAKLLRVLENGEYQRVGETQTRVSRARVVAATNRDLREEIKQGRFRSGPLSPPFRLHARRSAAARARRRQAAAPRLLPRALCGQERRPGLRARPRGCGALARLPLSRQRARAEERRDPPHHEIRRARRGRARARSRARPGNRARGQRTRRPGTLGSPRREVQPRWRPQGCRAGVSRRGARNRPGQHVAGGEAARHLAHHALRTPRSRGTRC